MTNITEIAQAYADLARPASPSITIDVRDAWRRTAGYYRASAFSLLHDNRLLLTVTDNPEPYLSAAAQAADVRTERNFTVSRAFCDHPVWDPWDNISYRIVHDLTGHAALDRTVSLQDVPDFHVAGELSAWSRQVSALLADPMCTETIMRASFTETVGQLAYAAVTGDFHPHQPIGFLDFDPVAPVIDDRGPDFRKGLHHVV